MAYGDLPDSFPWPKGLPPVWTEYPALTFRAEEWRMRVAGAQHNPVEAAMAELDREDAIMSAVRAVARGG